MAFVTVQGAVGRVFYEGKGAEIVESWKGADGKTMTKRWTAWFAEPHGLSEGDQAKVSGIHSDLVDEWTDKESQVRHTVKRSINKAHLEGDRPQPPAEEPWAASAPAGDVWNQPGDDSESTPF